MMENTEATMKAPKVEIIDVYDGNELFAICELCQREVNMDEMKDHYKVHSFAAELAEDVTKCEDVKSVSGEKEAEQLRLRAKSVDSIDSGVVCSPISSPSLSVKTSALSPELENKPQIERITPPAPLDELVNTAEGFGATYSQTYQSDSCVNLPYQENRNQPAAAARYHPYQRQNSESSCHQKSSNNSVNMTNQIYPATGHSQDSLPSPQLQQEYAAWQHQNAVKYHCFMLQETHKKFMQHLNARQRSQNEVVFLKTNYDPINPSILLEAEKRFQYHSHKVRYYHEQIFFHKKQYYSLQQQPPSQNWNCNQAGRQQAPTNQYENQQGSHKSQAARTDTSSENTGEYQLRIETVPNHSEGIPTNFQPHQNSFAQQNTGQQQQQQRSTSQQPLPMHQQQSRSECRSAPQPQHFQQHKSNGQQNYPTQYSGGSVEATSNQQQFATGTSQTVQQQNPQPTKFQQIAEAGRQYQHHQNIQRQNQDYSMPGLNQVVSNVNNLQASSSHTFSQGSNYGYPNPAYANSQFVPSSTSSVIHYHPNYSPSPQAAPQTQTTAVQGSNNSPELHFPIHCSWCGKNFQNEVAFYQHRERDHNMTCLKVGKHCHICGKIYHSTKGHISHLQTQHNCGQNIQEYYSKCQCWKCEESFRDLETFKLHLNESHFIVA